MSAVILRFILVCVVGYFIGSIPFGLIIGSFYGIDVRNSGSGKTGATNMLRNAGPLPALGVAVGDAAKGAIPVLLAQHLLATPHSLDTYANLTPWIAGFGGLSAILGHNYPIYVGFRGGRGVASTGGMALAIAFPASMVALVVFVAIIATTRYVSLGSMVGAVTLPLVEWFFTQNHLANTDSDGTAYTVILLIAAISIIFSHHDNIQRLMTGTERRLGEKSKPVPSL